MDTAATSSGSSTVPRNPFARILTSHSRHKQTRSQLSSLQSQNSALSAQLSQIVPIAEDLRSQVTALTNHSNALSSEGVSMKSENDSLRQRLEAAMFRATEFSIRTEELSEALHQSVANHRVGMWETDTATTKALSTAKEREAARKDIMSSLSKRNEIKSFVTDILRSQVDAIPGDFDFTKDDLVKAMDLEPWIDIGPFGWEMRLGIPGNDGYITKNLKSPKFEDVNNRYSFKTAESAVIDETVDFLAEQGAKALKTLPSIYIYSIPVLEKIRGCDWDRISSAASMKLRDPIKDRLISNTESRLTKKAMGQGTLSGLSMVTIPWIDETSGKLNVEMGFESRDGYFESTGKPSTINLGSTLLLGLDSWKSE
ncbi:hypothetical protein C356_06423 [Cryptococcus neoformans c45]|nr:hypothetical protein C356_06423 [Cryptococcus neoformans var. grubii c45]